MNKTIENTSVGGTLTIIATVKDNKGSSISKDNIANLMRNGEIWWESSNSKVLRVTSTDAKNGQCIAYVKGESAGTATLYIMSSKEKTYCQVTVKSNVVATTPVPIAGSPKTTASSPTTVSPRTTSQSSVPNKTFNDIRGKFEIMPFKGFSCLDLAPQNLNGLHANPDEIIKQIADAKITTIVLNNNRGYPDVWNDEVMDILIKKFAQRNVKVLVDDYRICALLSDLDNVNNYCYNSSRDYNKLKELVNKYSGYSNVLGFYIFDEPGINGFSTLAQFTKDINKITNNKKEVYINLFPNYASAAQLKGTTTNKDVSSASVFKDYYDDYLLGFVKGRTAVPTSVLSFDHYSTYFTDARGSLMSFYQNLLNVLAASRASDTRMIPMNYIIILDQRIGGEHYRYLNIDEIAYQVSANLAFGMKRLGYYACITAPNGIAKTDSALFNYNSERTSDSAIGKRKSPTTEHYNMVSDINNKWAYNLGVELYRKDLQNIYEISNKKLLTQYTSSSADYKNVGSISNSKDGVLISTFDDKSFLLVNTNFTENNIIGFDNLSNYKFFDYELNRWVAATNKVLKYSSKNKSKAYVTVSLNSNTITLAPGHCILLKRVASLKDSVIEVIQTASSPKLASREVTPKPTVQPVVKTATPKPAVKTATPKPKVAVKTATPKPVAVKTATPKPVTVKTATPKPKVVVKTATPKPIKVTATPRPKATNDTTAVIYGKSNTRTSKIIKNSLTNRISR